MPAHATPPSFAELLASTPPRERSGSRSSNRFSYQQSWALTLVLTLHEKPADYCVLFDVHEDVVVVDNPQDPTSGEFYQVKTKSTGTWTAHNLTEREKNKGNGTEKPSILGKLYSNYVRFSGFVQSMSFITNAPFAISMQTEPSCTDREQFCITDIETVEQAEIMTRIAAEHGVTFPPEGLLRTFLVQTPLSVLDHERHSIGIVADFLQKRGDETIPSGPFLRTLQSEIRRRNDKEYAATTFADLSKHKGLCRSQFQRMLDTVPSQRRMDDLVSLIQVQLVNEGYSLRQQGHLNSEVRNYLSRRLDSTNTMISEARRRIEAEVSSLPDLTFQGTSPISDVISRVILTQAKELLAVLDRYSDSFLKAMIAVAVYEQHEFSSVSPQPPEEDA